MQKHLTILLLCLAAAAQGFAQFNDSTHHRFRYLGAGSLNKTDLAKAYLLSNSLMYDVSKPNYAFSSTANWIYGQQNKLLTNNDFSAGANFDFRKAPNKVFYWAYAGYQSSYSLQVNYKVQAGAGAGYIFLDDASKMLNISDGFLYEANNLKAMPENDVYSTIRNSFRLKYKFVIDKNITLGGSNFFQPSLLSINDYIISLNNNISYKVKQWLNLTAGMNYNRINRTRKENLLLTFGVSIDRYF